MDIDEKRLRELVKFRLGSVCNKLFGEIEKVEGRGVEAEKLRDAYHELWKLRAEMKELLGVE